MLPSCDRCRRRKQKCDKAQSGCSNCRNAELECVYPARKGRAPKRRQAVPQLAERLSRLEGIIRQGTEPQVESNSKTSELDASFGRLVVDGTSSYYVNNALWSTLASEVKELTDVLLDPVSVSDDESDAQASAVTEESAADSPNDSSRAASNAAILGYNSAAHSLRSFHPSLAESAALFAAFIDNVAPVIRIFHVPSLTRVYWDAVASLDTVDRDTEALIFALYYATAVSISPDESTRLLAAKREDVLERYRFATEQALARADLLNTQSLRVLQASVIFLAALRNQDESRKAWALTALTYHIAQAMGLHRDGEAFGLKPFETEMRRRLWWHICFLDFRNSDYHGYEPITRQSTFDTKPPLHVNDSDLTPDMTQPPLERQNEATDMTFVLVRYEAMLALWRLASVTGQSSAAQAEREATVKEFERSLHEKYLKHCSASPHPYQRLVTVAVARVMTARLWMLILYPRISKIKQASHDQEPKLNDPEQAVPADPERDVLFQVATDILETSGGLLTDPHMSRWAWHSKTHIQWSAVAFVLSELCRRPPSPESERAWTVANVVYDAWRMSQNTCRGTFSVLIKRLMAKAKYVRQTSPSAGSVASGPSNTWLNSGSLTSPVTPDTSALPEDYMMGLLETQDLNALMDFMPHMDVPSQVGQFNSKSATAEQSNDFGRQPHLENPGFGQNWQMW